MKEYSIIAKELQDIMELIANGWECDKFEPDTTLYVHLTNGTENIDFEFVQC